MDSQRELLEKQIEDALTDEVISGLGKKISSAIDEASDQFERNLRNDLAYNLGLHIEQQARYVIEAILQGDEEQFRRYLGANHEGYTGRHVDQPVIHGKLYESGCIATRKSIVDAYPELLKNERILDLEDQLDCLTKTVARLQRERGY